MSDRGSPDRHGNGLLTRQRSNGAWTNNWPIAYARQRSASSIYEYRPQIFANCVNTLNHYRVMRALMLAFDRWVRDGVEPPPNTYPRIADGTLVTIVGHAQAFPRIPDFRLPEGNLRPPRLDLGSRFETERIADEVPPTIGKPFETLVAKPDADGLDEGGIALPEVLVPLGTRTGFNTRNTAAGFPWATGRWDGSFVPFPRTDMEQQASGDPRPSIQARYANRAA